MDIILCGGPVGESSRGLVSGCGHLNLWGPPSIQGEPGMWGGVGHIWGALIDE